MPSKYTKQISQFRLVTDIEALSKPSEEIDVGKGFRLSQMMRAWLKNFNREHEGITSGIGLSACQIGIWKQVFIVHLNYSKFLAVNPVIVAHSDQTILNTESCLSLPGVKATVPRYVWVELRCANWPENRFFGLHPMASNYEDIKKNLLEAIVCQHEYDHVLGTLIINYNTN